MILTILALLAVCHAGAQVEGNFVTVGGTVFDSQTRKPVDNAMVFVPDETLGVVTNEDGRFVLRIPVSVGAKEVRIARIGYVTSSYPVPAQGRDDAEIFLKPVAYPIQEIIIRLSDPYKIFEEAYSRVEENYSGDHEKMTTFYRETVKKGNRYITISEAVSEIYKTPYSEGVARDLVRLSKGRKLAAPKPSDTLAVKLMGGMNMGVDLDFVKNYDLLFADIRDKHYRLTLGAPAMIDDTPHYVINFEPAVTLPDVLLLRGRLFIDQKTLAFSRAEMSVDLADRGKAEANFVKRKPPGLRFTPDELVFTAVFKKEGGVSRLYYVNSFFKFRCDWKRKLFRSRYEIVAETVVT